MKKFISILMILCLVLVLTPAITLAADPTTVPLDLTKGEAKLSGDGWKWEWNDQKKSGTLTLDGLDLHVTDSDGIFLPDGDVQITLEIISDHVGFHTWDGDITINKGTINIAALDTGICAYGNVIINSGDIAIYARYVGIDAEGYYDGEVFGGSIALKGGSLDITGGEDDDFGGMAVIAWITNAEEAGFTTEILKGLIDTDALTLATEPINGSVQTAFIEDGDGFATFATGSKIQWEEDALGRYIGNACFRVYTTEQFTFSDISGHWAQDVIMGIAGKGIVNGYTDGSFKPNNPTTRAEFLAMMLRALRVEASAEEIVAAGSFTDAALIPTWAT